MSDEPKQKQLDEGRVPPKPPITVRAVPPNESQPAAIKGGRVPAEPPKRPETGKKR